MSDCLFCKIIGGEIPSKKVYEDESCYAFEDISPQARVHILLIPKKHIASISDATADDQALLGHLMLCAGKIAKQMDVDQSGYRLITNRGDDARQSVKHLHLHILGGEVLSEKMG